MIIGTAGHIDHGKTTLVRALTGVDTDRLPEEQRRGITLELGYAFLDTACGERIGFVDVPGHERLVHTMLAGATGMDHALLLVAADDGVMPQTREHLAVLSLLGLTSATVVVTKADRADAARRAAVVAEAAALLRGSTLEGAPVLAVSAHSGDGLPALRARLDEVARAAQQAQAARGDDDAAAFRLAIDRAFTLGGVGTVVTGTIHAGQVTVGDELRLVPGERSLRVRSLHAQNRPVDRARAGERCAVALAGIEKSQIERGQWLVAPAAALATDRFDATLTLWHDEARPLRSGTPVHVHVGAASVMGTVAVLEGDALPSGATGHHDALGRGATGHHDALGRGATGYHDALRPGATGRVQLVLRSPLAAWHGDRVVLRDAAATRTLAGGTVLDPFAPMRYRRTPQRLAELSALALPDAGRRLAGLLDQALHGVDLRRLAAAQGRCLTPDMGGPDRDRVLRHTDVQGDWALGATQAATAQQAVLAALADFHTRHPDELGPDAARLRRLALPRLPEPLWRALLARAQGAGLLAVRGAFVHLPAHGVKLSAAEERIAQKVAAPLAAAGFDGAWVRDLARDIAEPEPLLRVTLARLAQRGELHQVVKDLYYPHATVATLVVIARDGAAARGGEVTAAGFRDATGLGRKRAIQILEYFDRIGLLRRVGDTHRLRTDSALLADAANAGPTCRAQ